jgi:hypothetical protein
LRNLFSIARCLKRCKINAEFSCKFSSELWIYFGGLLRGSGLLGSCLLDGLLLFYWLGIGIKRN